MVKTIFLDDPMWDFSPKIASQVNKLTLDDINKTQTSLFMEKGTCILRLKQSGLFNQKNGIIRQYFKTLKAVLRCSSQMRWSVSLDVERDISLNFNNNKKKKILKIRKILMKSHEN